MWEPPDVNAFPTPWEKKKARHVISTLEKELRKARLRVKQLQADLYIRKAWIAPVRRATFDVLSLVFEFCANDDWKIPLTLAAVSRSWRIAALASPRVWSFIKLEDCPSQDMITLFLGRSGDCPIHASTFSANPFTLFERFAHRLQCLSFDMDHQFRPIPFQNLKRLIFISSDVDIPLSLISVAYFPALRYLVCRGTLYNDFGDGLDLDSIPIINFPPLEELFLFITNDYTWSVVLRGCKGTLLSLNLYTFNYPSDVLDLGSISKLPLCQTIVIDCWDLPGPIWVFGIETPLLTYYAEFHYNTLHDDGCLHTDTGRVVHLRTNQQPPPSSAVPNLQILEIDFLNVSLLNYLSKLFSNEGAYPKLERISYCERGDSPDESELEDVSDRSELEECEDLMICVNSGRPRQIIFNIVKTWQDDVPGTIKYSCGAGMPCHLG